MAVICMVEGKRVDQPRYKLEADSAASGLPEVSESLKERASFSSADASVQ